MGWIAVHDPAPATDLALPGNPPPPSPPFPHMPLLLSDASDAQLLAWCRAGQNTAWQALVHRYRRLIYTVPRRAGLDEHDAADVMQACFAALFDQMHRLTQPDRLSAWLVTLARRETLRLLQHRRRHPGLATLAGPDADDDGGDAVAHIADEALLPPEQLAALQQQDRLQRALATLDSRSRELLTALYLRDPPLAYDQIADLLELAPGSIGPTRQRSLDKLRRALENLP